MTPAPLHTGMYGDRKLYFVRLKFVRPVNKCEIIADGVDKSRKYRDKQKG